MRSSMRFLNLWMQIALEWLHECCMLCVVGREEAGARNLVCSTLLGAAAACVILVSFAAEDRKSYWSGCIQAAIVICQEIFAILVCCNFRHRCA